MSDIGNGFFGEYGGRYVAEILRPAIEELDAAFRAAMKDQTFKDEFAYYLKNYIGRPTPLLYAENATRELGGAKIYLKLEGLANTGAHKINNALGQALLARRMGKKRIIAETGAGQHGLATAASCARLGMECEIFMGEVDMRRQKPNVFGMELFGAKVTSVTSGTKTLKDAVNETMREWARRKDDTHYIIGSALGPAPYPDMVREFQRVIGDEVRAQIKEYGEKQPDVLIACAGGGSNAIGFFTAFMKDAARMIAIEAGGRGPQPGDHAARVSGSGGGTGIVQGYKSLFLQDDNGQLLPTHSISAGLDYAGLGPELAHLAKTGRIEFASALDDEVLAAVKFFARTEGIIPALESSHALAHAMKLAPTLSKDTVIAVNVSGRGDKDIFITARALDGDAWIAFLKEEVASYEKN